MADTVDQWNAIVRHDVIRHESHDKPLHQGTRPANHNSADGQRRSIRRHLRKGQQEGRYLIVVAKLLARWPEIFISPLAVVDKPGAVKVDIRLINDYNNRVQCDTVSQSESSEAKNLVRFFKELALMTSVPHGWLRFVPRAIAVTKDNEEETEEQ
ncbi:unnamed protein product [Phytophthora fragariaefolia]|uniref:Unnamed protein product n=1 Tax=Phytophthora fragariaefolia TaxID=1490495 RepID=A0A9W6Y242_9STRA|nr:unnamed protein product [Phytophthora fragariaefolia]